MPRDMKNQPQSPQRSQRINDILCEIRDPGGFSDQRKGVETKAKDLAIFPGIVPHIVAFAGVFDAQSGVGICMKYPSGANVRKYKQEQNRNFPPCWQTRCKRLARSPDRCREHIVIICGAFIEPDKKPTVITELRHFFSVSITNISPVLRDG